MNASALRVGVDESPAPPLCCEVPGTPDFRGFEVDLLESIAGRLGLCLQGESLGWEPALERLLDARLDMLCRAVTITSERSRVVGSATRTSKPRPYLALGVGNVAAVVDHATIASHFVQQVEGLRMTDALEGSRLSYGMVFAPSNVRLRQAVNSVLAALRADGTLNRHRDRWLADLNRP